MVRVTSHICRLAIFLMLTFAIWLTGCEEGVGKKYLTYFPGSTFVGTSSAWLVTSDGDMFRTTNGGKNWVRVPGEIINEFRQVSFITSDVGWTVNSSGQIWSSNNGGQNWRRIGSLEPYSVELGRSLYLAFVDGKHGWVGNGSFIWRSI
ncbi:MAG: hypothetical protein L0Y56_14035, partial [Nitrospira sp.]|nr:hypothetical protein [Nitrospira sp.]